MSEFDDPRIGVKQFQHSQRAEAGSINNMLDDAKNEPNKASQDRNDREQLKPLDTILEL